MLNNEAYMRGDIFFANLEGSGSIQKGIRPVIIIQNDIGNKYSSTVIVATVTSQMKKCNQPTHVVIEKDNLNNLRCDSVIQLEQIRTVNKSSLIKKLGKIKELDLKKLNEALAISVALKTEEKKYQIINRKIIEIRDIEVSLALYSKNIELRNRLLNERNIAIKDAEYFCKEHDLDFNDYYIPFNLNEIEKVVV